MTIILVVLNAISMFSFLETEVPRRLGESLCSILVGVRGQDTRGPSRMLPEV